MSLAHASQLSCSSASPTCCRWQTNVGSFEVHCMCSLTVSCLRCNRRLVTFRTCCPRFHSAQLRCWMLPRGTVLLRCGQSGAGPPPVVMGSRRVPAISSSNSFKKALGCTTVCLCAPCAGCCGSAAAGRHTLRAGHHQAAAEGGGGGGAQRGE